MCAEAVGSGEIEIVRTATLILALVVAGPAGSGPARPATAPAPARHVVVFDFACPERAAYGAQLADSIRLRLRRHEEYEVIDRLTTAELAPAAGVSLKTPDAQVVKLLRERLGAHLAIYGDVQKLGRSVRVEVRCIDISGAEPAAWTKAFSDETERARGVIASQVVEAIRGAPEWQPPEYGDEPEPKSFAKPLNVNGGFDAGHKGWARPDNVSTLLLADPRTGRKGKVLKIFTDLDRDAWLAYQRDLMLGKADPARPPKIPPPKGKYSSVGALEGVHYRSDWIEATPGGRYWLVADMMGRSAGMFFPKIFVKGFADFSALADGLSDVSLNELGLTPEKFAELPKAKRDELIKADAKKNPQRYRREVYRWYLACRNKEGVWQHYAAPFPPRGRLPANVRWLRIEVYAYWPAGEYFFDDVHLYKDPRQKAPLPEVKPRTPHYKRPTTQPTAVRR